MVVLEGVGVSHERGTPVLAGADACHQVVARACAGLLQPLTFSGPESGERQFRRWRDYLQGERDYPQHRHHRT